VGDSYVDEVAVPAAGVDLRGCIRWYRSRPACVVDVAPALALLRALVHPRCGPGGGALLLLGLTDRTTRRWREQLGQLIGVFDQLIAGGTDQPGRLR
jgi:hypothetical protein